MKLQFAIRFSLFILFIITVLVGIPRLLQIMRDSQISFPFLLPSPNLPPAQTPAPQFRQSAVRSAQSESGAVLISGINQHNGIQQITLSALRDGQSVNLTGWKIKSLRKGEIFIGKGINLLQFDANLSDIRLNRGESAKIITSPSPIGGNFRVNNCFGGLAGIYNFGLSFNYCPQTKFGNVGGLDSACQDLIMRSSSCRSPSDDILNRQSSGCRVWFEKNVNYSTCAIQHRNDGDFYRGWQIYTGNANPIFDSLHDTIWLVNPKGAVVDIYRY